VFACSVGVFIWFLAVGLFVLIAGQLFAADSSKLADQEWALLIGVSQYEKAPKLPYIDRDVLAMASVLEDYGGVKPAHVRSVYDGAPDALPNKANIEKAIQTWLKKLQPMEP